MRRNANYLAHTDWHCGDMAVPTFRYGRAGPITFWGWTHDSENDYTRYKISQF